MFHEYALDPDVLKTWPAFRYLTEQFGMSQGRLISKFPSKWKRAVYEACSGTSPVEKSRIEEGLRRIDPKLYSSGRTYVQAVDWIQNATQSHESNPFRAIVTTSEKCGSPGTIDHESITEETECWLSGIAPIKRQPKDMAAAAAKLLKCSSEIIFVDQHFSCAARHGRPLTAFIASALQGSKVKRLEYHLASNDKSADWFGDALGKQARHFNLPNGVRLKFFRWKEKPGGEEFHARYILTELGGIRFDVGLDDADDPVSQQTTDVAALDVETHRQRFKEFHPASETFSLVDSWIVYDGKVEKVER